MLLFNFLNDQDHSGPKGSNRETMETTERAVAEIICNFENELLFENAGDHTQAAGRRWQQDCL